MTTTTAPARTPATTADALAELCDLTSQVATAAAEVRAALGAADARRALELRRKRDLIRSAPRRAREKTAARLAAEEKADAQARADYLTERVRLEAQLHPRTASTMPTPTTSKRAAG